MIENYAKGRVAVFIDAANILYSQQTMRWSVDYIKLMHYLTSKADISLVRFYYGRIYENEGQTRFFEILGQAGYSLCTKPVKYIETKQGKILKGNLDIELAIDMIELKSTYDTAVLMSGDSDFEVVIRKLHEANKRVIAISSRGHISREIARGADKYIPLECLRQFIEKGF